MRCSGILLGDRLDSDFVSLLRLNCYYSQMSYQFKAQESIPVGVKRIAREQIAQSVKQLKAAADNSKEEAVHESRKRLKEIRALLRLVQKPLGKKTYRRENECFRDAGRQLSDVRDAQVLIKTLDKLAEHFPDSESDAFTTIRGELKDHYSSVYQQAIEQGNNVSVVTNSLKVAKKRINSWSIEPDNWSALSPGLKKIYKQGYKVLLRLASNRLPKIFTNGASESKICGITSEFCHPFGQT